MNLKITISQPLSHTGMKKASDPRNSTAAKKIKVFGIGLETVESESAAKDSLTYPFKNSHQNLLDGLAKVLIDDAREVSCCRQREIR